MPRHLWPAPGVAEGAGPLAGTNSSFLMQRQDVQPVANRFLLSNYNGLSSTIQPPSGDHSHFDTISASPNVVTGANSPSGFGTWSLRTAAELAAVGNAQYTENWSIDPGYDAAQLNFFTGFSEGMTLDSGRQLWMDFARVDVAGGNTFSLQYELMYDSQYVDLSGCPNWSGIHKTIRCDHRAKSAGTDERVFEFNNDSLNAAIAKDYPAQPRIRSYIQPRSGDEKLSVNHSAFDRRYPFSLFAWDDQGTRPGGAQTVQWDRQPSIQTSLDYQQIAAIRESDHLAMAAGDVDKPFLHRSNIWARITMYWVYEADGVLRFEYWAADETTDPVMLFGHKDTDGNEGKGFDTWNTGAVVYGGVPNSGLGTVGDYFADNAIDRIRCEFNSSGGGNPPTFDYKLWVRNFCVWSSATGQKIPLGGRPIKTGTIS